MLNALCIRDEFPFFEGPDEENGERSDTVRPSLASRPMSLYLAVYCFILQARKTNSCTLLDSPARNLLGRAATLFKVSCIPMGIS
jgi:hypothetical protein